MQILSKRMSPANWYMAVVVVSGVFWSAVILSMVVSPVAIAVGVGTMMVVAALTLLLSRGETGGELAMTFALVCLCLSGVFLFLHQIG